MRCVALLLRVRHSDAVTPVLAADYSARHAHFVTQYIALPVCTYYHNEVHVQVKVHLNEEGINKAMHVLIIDSELIISRSSNNNFF